MAGTLRGLGQVIQARVAESPNDVAFIYLRDGESDEQVLTFGELDKRARALAHELTATVGVGERAVLLYPPGLDFIIGIFACFYSGVVAVPGYPPDPTRLARTLPRLQAMIEDADAKVILTTSGILMAQEVVLEIAPDLENYRWIATDEERPDEAFVARPIKPSDIAIVQYTSGSTGAPRGVVITQENFLSNLASQLTSFGCDRDGVGVLWLPHYHDMGLMSMFCSAYSGMKTTMISPLDFLQKPVRWLNAISKYKATGTAAPNFAFGLSVRKTTPAEREAMDLSSMRACLIGAEPITPSTIEAFLEAFGPRGFKRSALRPSYGLAEATVMVSTSPAGTDPVVHAHAGDDGKPVERISCGHAVDAEALVVDTETFTKKKDGDIGELWIRGKQVAQGYWRKEADANETFRGMLASGDGPYLRTGDLAYMIGPEIFVTGRHKDLIIVRGRNFYPNDIERTIEATTNAVRPGCGAAFSVSSAETEQAVVVYELDARGKVDVDALITLLRSEVAGSHDLVLDAVVFVQPRSIPKTSSGKIMRRATRQAFEDGTLEIVAQWRQTDVAKRPSRDDGTLRGWLTQWCTDNLGVADVDPTQPLSNVGLTSITAVKMCGDLSEKLGRRVQAPLLLKYPTIDAFSAYLETSAQANKGGAK